MRRSRHPYLAISATWTILSILHNCLSMPGASAAQESHMPSTVLIGPNDVEFWESVTKEAEKNEPVRHEGFDAKALTPLAMPTLTMSKSAGPGLEIIQPKLDVVKSPFELFVRFLPRDSQPDPKSIQVIAQKWILQKFRGERDITDKVRPFVNAEGIHVTNTEVPSGRYEITLRVTDVSGRLSEGIVILEITKK